MIFFILLIFNFEFLNNDLYRFPVAKMIFDSTCVCLRTNFDELVCFLIFYIRFLRGDQYAIALALLDRGKVVLGVLACPNLPLTFISGADWHSPNNEVGCLFFAEVGGGTYMQPLDGSSTVKVIIIYL